MADNNNFMGSTLAVAVTTAILSPRVRGLLRKGAVQGLAGALIAGDAVSSFARGIGRGLQADPAGPSATETVREAARAAEPSTEAAQEVAKPKASSRTRKTARKKASTKAGGSKS
jgi:hypothetical protein